MRRAGLLLLALMLSSERVAQSAPENDPVILRVGSSEVRAREFGERLGLLHEFERASFGSTAAEVRQNYIARKLLPELLQAEEARRRGMHERAAVRDRTRTLLAAALKEHIITETDAQLTDAEIQRYCEQSKLPAQDTRGAPRDCKRDFLSYRIALRREKASKALTELSAELSRTLVKHKDDAPVLSLVIPEKGPPLVKPPAEAK